MTLFLKLKPFFLKLANNKKVNWLLTVTFFIVVIILYRNLGKFLLTDRLINSNPLAAEVGYKESHLPQEVISMKTLALKAKVTDFRMSDLIKRDEAMNQRAIEFLYPIRENVQSKFLFVTVDESVNINCIEKGRDGKVVLYNCK